MEWFGNEFSNMRGVISIGGNMGDASVGQPPGLIIIHDHDTEIEMSLSLNEVRDLRDMLIELFSEIDHDGPDPDEDCPDRSNIYEEMDMFDDFLMERYESLDPIWGAGYEAYESGLLLDACPHPSGTDEADRWTQGWTQAKDLPF